MKRNIKYVLIILMFLTQIIYSQRNFTIQVANFSFTPKDITITAGDTVTFVWISGSHTTTSDSTSGPDSWNSEINSSVPVFKKVILYPGLHRYYCIPHGGPNGAGMSGTITAAANPTDVASDRSSLLAYDLEQNYPNPFNPSTRISYSIPENNLVTLKVFNLLGEEVAILVNEFKSKGNYTIDFNAGGLSNGIYFYQLKAGNYVSVRKMTLIK
ncbi:MAG: T9SS type A sorting domain-containing protein [Bacillota bacterium]